MKKIMVVIPSLWTGGGEKIAVDIASRISGNEAEVLFVTYIDAGDTPVMETARKSGIPVLCLNKRPGPDPGLMLRLAKAIRAYKPDVIHAHLKVMQHLLVPLLFTRPKSCFYTVHSLAERDGRGIMRYINLLSFRLCGVVPIAISQTCRKSLAEFYHMNEDRIICINNGINTEKYKRTIPYEALEDSVIRLVYVGRLEKAKNCTLLLEAFADAAAVHPGIQLTLIGRGTMETELTQLAEALGIRDKVIFAGLTGRVAEYLKSSHIFVMSSDVEGLPLAVLEAISAGLPIVSTNAGGIADAVRDGYNGLLCKTGDRKALADNLVRIIENRDMRLRMSRGSTRLSEQFDIGICAEKYKELYLDSR